MKTGIANLPLHYGTAPPWLMERMKKLAREITIWIVREFGAAEMLKKLSDPFWFQAFGCVLGFDWHSSGLTTTVCGALKGGIKGLEKDLGLFIAGGKGKASRETPREIERAAETLSMEPTPLVYASKMAAKVDNNALQDGYMLYHHCFIFTKEGTWGVIQQGMNEGTGYARRYHWLSTKVEDFVNEPHSAICTERKERAVLNLVHQESEKTRVGITYLATTERPEKLILQLKRLQNMELPPHHQIFLKDLSFKRLQKILLNTHEKHPTDFQELLGMEGVGPKTIRALSLISELIYGSPPSFKDPARFSFAHGGKDGHPYPVDRESYDRSIEILREAVLSSKLGNREKLEAIKRLYE